MAARAEGEWAVKGAEEWEPLRAVVAVAWVDRAAVAEAWAVRVVEGPAAEEQAGEAEPGSREESLHSMGRWKTDDPAKEARLRKAETQVRGGLKDKGDEDRAGRWASRN